MCKVKWYRNLKIWKRALKRLIIKGIQVILKMTVPTVQGSILQRTVSVSNHNYCMCKYRNIVSKWHYIHFLTYALLTWKLTPDSNSYHQKWYAKQKKTLENTININIWQNRKSREIVGAGLLYVWHCWPSWTLIRKDSRFCDISEERSRFSTFKACDSLVN